MTIPGLLNDFTPAVLALAEGSIFSGMAIGASGSTVGEVVFNTAMTGYQEILTDPSYAEQIVTLTYPHIGNVGINPHDQESSRAQVAGLIIRELSLIASNWQSTQSLTEYLIQQKVVAIAGIDTRRLTRILREKGAQNGCIMTGDVEPSLALEKANAYPGLEGKDLAQEVTCKKNHKWNEPTFELDQPDRTVPEAQYHVVVYDFGVKHQMLRMLVDRGCRVTQVPAKTPASKVLKLQPDGILLSNGPADPKASDYAIEAIKTLSEHDVPLLGICLGFQLMALAFGASTVKMKFGHHGANHPVENVATKQVYITSQNHSFAVDANTLPDDLIITHRSLFDGSLQGFAHKNKPFFAFQGHPEASPGPHDIVELFDQFIEKMKNKIEGQTRGS